MRTHPSAWLLLILCVVTGFLLVKRDVAQQPIYLLGNAEFTPITCLDGHVPRYDLVQKKFVCTYPVYVSPTDPACSEAIHVGRIWFDTTTTTTGFKVCIAKKGSVSWSTITAQ